MSNVINEVVTNNLPENSKGGILVCGINLGYSKSDKANDESKRTESKENLSFFSDMTVRKSDKFRNKVVIWLSSWGYQFAIEPGKETSFERSFIQTNWLYTQTENANVEGTISNLINNAEGILNIIKERQPSVILFFGKKLIEAFNDTTPVESLKNKSVRDIAIEILGKRSGNGIRIDGKDENGIKIRTHLMHQKFGNTQIICFPHPTGSRGIRDRDIMHLKPAAEILTGLSNKCT